MHIRATSKTYFAWLFGVVRFFLLILSFGPSQAATYTLPGAFSSAPFNCTLASGTTYNCPASITIGNNNTVTSSATYTLNVTGNITLDNNVTFGSSTYPLNLIASGTVTFGNSANTDLYGNVTASILTIGNNAEIHGTCTYTTSCANCSQCTGSVAKPSITTSAATSVSSTAATLNGSVSSNGATTSVNFGYSGTSGSYTSTCTPTTSTYAGNTSAQVFSCNISGLTCNTAYFFRATGTNIAGTTYGGGLSFTTSACTTETPGNFNAVDAGSDEVTGVIKTKIAGQAFNLDIHALNNAGNNTLPSYTGTMSYYLVDASSSASCGSMTVLQSLGSHTYTGAGSGKDNGVYTLSITYANAAPNVKIKMVDSSAGVTACSTDAYAIRPYSLANTASSASAVAATDATWETAGTTRTLNNSSASGGNLHKAGRPFTVRAQSWSATGVATTGYTGTPSLTQVNCVLPATACVSGTLLARSDLLPDEVITLPTSAGLASTSTATYSEVGTITAMLSDSAFAAIDASDGSTLAERTVESAAFTIGRFVPDHFAISPNTPAFTPGCGTFTYLGQPFGFGTAPVWTVTAQNASNGTTQNYTDTLFKLTGSSITSQTWSATSGSLSPVGILPDPTVSDLGLGLVSVTFAVGNPASGGGLAFARTAVAAPFDASLTLSANFLDSENVAYTSNPYTQTGIAFGGNDSQRFGRLRISNASGSELLALPMPFTAQYWNGSGFVTNTADACTALAAPTLTFFTQTTNNQLASGETTATSNNPFVAGLGGLRLTAPGNGNYGYLDVTVTAPAWLQYNWDGIDQGGDSNLFDDNPRSRAAFGKRRGSDKVIIRREIY
jgi:hypothetical protein